MHRLAQKFIFYVVNRERVKYGIKKLSRKLGKMDERQVASLQREILPIP